MSERKRGMRERESMRDDSIKSESKSNNDSVDLEAESRVVSVE